LILFLIETDVANILSNTPLGLSCRQIKKST
jgi:hypothetical protein